MALLCVIRPEDDTDTEIASEWWPPLLALCPVEFKDLQGKEATRISVEDAIPTSKAVLYLGHGTRESLCTFDEAVIFLDRQNISLAAGKIIIALACDSAAGLGTSCSTCGVHAYIGFDDALGTITTLNFQFGKAATSGMATLLSGGSTGEAAQTMKREFTKLAMELWQLEEFNDDDESFAWFWARWNADHLVLCGDSEARVTW